MQLIALQIAEVQSVYDHIMLYRERNFGTRRCNVVCLRPGMETLSEWALSAFLLHDAILQN